MNTIDVSINSFREYADRLMNQQVEGLRNADKDLLVAGKLARIKVINENMALLKQQLRQEADRILHESGDRHVNYRDELSATLTAISDDVINEYLFLSYRKNGV